MAFLAISQLRAGMMLERNLYFYDDKRMEVVTTPAGKVLTPDVLKKMVNRGISGAYVKDTAYDYLLPSNLIIKTCPIPERLRQTAIQTIEAAFHMLLESPEHAHEIYRQTEDSAEELVLAMEEEEDAMVNLADLRVFDDCTYNHSLGVAIISIAIGGEMNLSEKQLITLCTAALLHDIGKIRIPIEIIEKRGPLTPEEFKLMKRHPVYGAEFLRKLGFVSRNIYDAVLYHHEKVDGSGYPDHLKDTEIPILSRIIAVADVYDALTAKRPYRNPAKPQEAIEYIMGGCGSSFDYDVVQAFLRRVSPYPMGYRVMLFDGQYAIVTKENPSNPLRPCIRLLNNPMEEIDLSSRLDAQSLVIKELCDYEQNDIVRTPSHRHLEAIPVALGQL